MFMDPTDLVKTLNSLGGCNSELHMPAFPRVFFPLVIKTCQIMLELIRLMLNFLLRITKCLVSEKKFYRATSTLELVAADFLIASVISRFL